MKTAQRLFVIAMTCTLIGCGKTTDAPPEVGSNEQIARALEADLGKPRAQWAKSDWDECFARTYENVIGKPRNQWTKTNWDTYQYLLAAQDSAIKKLGDTPAPH